MWLKIRLFYEKTEIQVINAVTKEDYAQQNCDLRKKRGIYRPNEYRMLPVPSDETLLG
jgi:hypothetical protein